MKKRGIMLASRKREGRQVYIYMYRDLFAEIIFKEDDPEKEAESLLLINGLKKLNQHLENETKSAS